MPSVGVAFRVPLVGYEGGSIGARKSRKGGNCFATVRAGHHVMNRGIAEAPPESRFVRVTESWILVVKRGDTEPNRSVDHQPAVTGRQAGSVARSSLAPLRRLVRRLSKC